MPAQEEASQTELNPIQRNQKKRTVKFNSMQTKKKL